MIVISSDKKFVFFHVPKTGGSSISHLLKRHGDNPPWAKRMSDMHATPERLDKKSNYDLSKLFKFCFIRNPWGRIVSYYRFHMYRLNYPKEIVEDPSLFSIYVRITEKSRALDGGWWPQMLWIKDSNGNENMNFVGRFENLQNDFDKVCERIGIDHVLLPHKNKTNGSIHYSLYYTDYLKNFIAEYFKDDIEYGDYKFETI